MNKLEIRENSYRPIEGTTIIDSMTNETYKNDNSADKRIEEEKRKNAQVLIDARYFVAR